MKTSVDINEKMEKIALEMVKVKSVNTTEGEREIGEFIEKYIREIPYFKEHPEYVIVRKLKDDVLERRNVLALLRGEAEGTVEEKARTLLLHGHTDTVGTEDYGALEEYACNPDLLINEISKLQLSDDVRTDLESGEYMFGRGACDMKSGDAVFIGLIEELSKHPERLKGNLLVSLNPVEENLHTGVIEALDILFELKEKYGLNYELAINNDYICPLFPGDTVKTIYTGVVGKLLPCFYIQGHETHVGQCFEGFDASMVAAKLVSAISLNPELSDDYMGEIALPPTVLKMKDLKPWYNVQTAHEAFVYFNYFVHNASIESIVENLKKKAEEVLKKVVENSKEYAMKFTEMSGQKMDVPEFKTEVISYEELKEQLIEAGAYSREELAERELRMAEDAKAGGVDAREVPIGIIREFLGKRNQKNPVIVLYFAPPYCPHNTLQNEDAKLIERIERISAAVEERSGEKYRMMKFFPSLSDSSYLRIDDDQKSVDCLKENFPAQSILYPVPIDKIQKIDIPTINYGCYGKDAHKWTERVNIPYTFGVLPELLMETFRQFGYVENKED